jgi:hypothetical protein
VCGSSPMRRIGTDAPAAMSLVALVGGLILFVASQAPASGQQPSQQPSKDVTICHRTASGFVTPFINPYVEQTVSFDSIITENGHGSHTGPVYPNMGPDGKWGDIIPPFDYPGGHYPGMNWDTDGQAVWNGGCDVDETPIIPPEETTTTLAPTTTTTLAPTTTTTLAPTTTTTLAPTTTTTLAPTTTTTLAPTTTQPPASTTQPPTSSSTSTTGPSSTSTTSPGGETTPTVAPGPDPPLPVDPPPPQEEVGPTEAVVIDPGPATVMLGPLNDQERIGLEAEIDASSPVPGATTPQTGKPFLLEEIVAGVLVAAGLGGLLTLLLKRRVRHEPK